jgi:hypothetical protein
MNIGVGGFREFVDAVLRHLDPLADANFGADGRPELVKSVEYPHRRRSNS